MLGINAVRLPFELPFDPAELTSITISACGTAYYAGLVAKYWFERYARLPVDVDGLVRKRPDRASLPVGRARNSIRSRDGGNPSHQAQHDADEQDSRRNHRSATHQPLPR